jgi:hypothetical protein
LANEFVETPDEKAGTVGAVLSLQEDVDVAERVPEGNA